MKLLLLFLFLCAVKIIGSLSKISLVIITCLQIRKSPYFGLNLRITLGFVAVQYKEPYYVNIISINSKSHNVAAYIMIPKITYHNLEAALPLAFTQVLKIT